MLQRTILRFSGFVSFENIIVITGRETERSVSEQCKELPEGDRIRIVTEYAGRNTAPAIALGMLFLEKELGISVEETVLVVPSDAVLSPPENFWDAVIEAVPVAKRGSIVVFGVPPTEADTGYGYIDMQRKGKRCFIEKPSLSEALEQIRKGEVLWNTGHILFTPKTFWKEMDIRCPLIAEQRNFRFSEGARRLADMESISIDYALLERSENVFPVKVEVFWSDIGTWDRIWQVASKDENGNVVSGPVAVRDCRDSLLFSQKKLVLASGLEGVIVVETEEGILITSRERCRDIEALLPSEGLQKEGMFAEIFS